MSKRINVMVSDRLNEELDRYSERYGMSKSSIVGFVVGQWLDNMERMNTAVYGATGNEGFLQFTFAEMMKEQKSDKAKE